MGSIQGNAFPQHVLINITQNEPPRVVTFSLKENHTQDQLINHLHTFFPHNHSTPLQNRTDSVFQNNTSFSLPHCLYEAPSMADKGLCFLGLDEQTKNSLAEKALVGGAFAFMILLCYLTNRTKVEVRIEEFHQKSQNMPSSEESNPEPIPPRDLLQELEQMANTTKQGNTSS